MQRKVINIFNSSVNLKKSDIITINDMSEKDEEVNKGFKKHESN